MPTPSRPSVPSASAKVTPPRGEPADPTRAALVEVLRLLNQAESFHDEREKGLELDEISTMTLEHWSVQKAGVKVPVIVGLLVRNRMVDHVGGTVRSWTRQRDFGPHYRINGEGKLFLAKFLEDSQRLSAQGQRVK
ncbi:MAG: hypothetical protein KGJ23_09220 [Euryarchaeota archaeon]|nr:hypothetical protein [Euryarchaeota archaeon]MDE1836785.1 hypothetical protein [Euryarchaeota archaeon]MDE1879803.1 hypothetical protein [Euryarchaeota archaeon]MDE2044769.1 hypothetical protein [Thermoplasmata archaeon]